MCLGQAPWLSMARIYIFRVVPGLGGPPRFSSLSQHSFIPYIYLASSLPEPTQTSRAKPSSSQTNQSTSLKCNKAEPHLPEI